MFNREPTSLPASAPEPSLDYGPIPFWWWVGEPLDFDRLVWQLDQLRAKGIRQAIISYNHHGDGLPNRGDPPVFSAAWWTLVRRLLDACSTRGMRLGFQDYTLLNPTLQEIGQASPDMHGAGDLVETHVRISGGETARPARAGSGIPVVAIAYPLVAGLPDAQGAIDWTRLAEENSPGWTAPPGAGEWLVSVVWLRSVPFDPLHPASGARAIERFYQPLVQHLGDHLGRTLTVSFQDELHFGSNMPFWSRGLPEAFTAAKGYSLLPRLPGLWHDLGPQTAKWRMDYADVVVGLLEASYFRPIYQWHQHHGLLFGHDNIGRGGIETGRRAYGDAFRTQRWFSAPGTDDPNLAGPRAFKGLKVNSSIAHLYRRPRVWNECFHSSGWGTSPASVVAALNADFALGATVVNLHGLYYSTFGSWWEWAPPDFHFRQPYWTHTDALSGYITRLCQLLSEGVHACDVAVLYPASALEGGLNPRVRPLPDREVLITEETPGTAGETLDAAEASAFGLGRTLFDAGVDFDYIDDESVARAEIAGGRLCVAGESYSVLILPYVSSVRHTSLLAALDFARAGGAVIVYGDRPRASDRAGSDDPALEACVDALLAAPRTRFVASGYQTALDQVIALAGRDFDPGPSRLQALHRRTPTEDRYFINNPSAHDIDAVVALRARGHSKRLNAWNGLHEPVELVMGEKPGPPGIRLRLAPGEAALLIVTPDEDPGPLNAHAETPSAESWLTLDDDWECEVQPTLDNRHGDFRRPPTTELLGPEARLFRHAEEKIGGGAGRQYPEFDDSSWGEVQYSQGHRFWLLGPLPPDADLTELENRLVQARVIDPALPEYVSRRPYHWQNYSFSTRWGVRDDPHLRDWAAGPHGLKGGVPDEFIDLHTNQPGARWFLWTGARSKTDREAVFVLGSRARCAAWLNGHRMLEQEVAMPPGRQSEWNLPHYACEPRRSPARLSAGVNPLLLRLEQPAGQRTRAFAAFEPQEPPAPPELALRWFAWPDHPAYDPRPDEPPAAHWFRFDAPPGLQRLTVVSVSPIQAWLNGRGLRLQDASIRPDGLRSSTFVAEATSPGRGVVALRAEAATATLGGALLPEPVRLTCGPGRMPPADWCAHGLAHFSGIVRYRRTVTLSDRQAREALALDLGNVAVSAEVWVNHRRLAVLITPPWRVDLRDAVTAGDNLIEVRVANTLANHFHIGVPTPYAPKEQTVSGLLGPVRLLFSDTIMTVGQNARPPADWASCIYPTDASEKPACKSPPCPSAPG